VRSSLSGGASEYAEGVNQVYNSGICSTAAVVYLIWSRRGLGALRRWSATRGRRRVCNCAHTTSAFTPSPLHFLCQSGAGAVEGGKPIVLHGGHPALDEVEPAVKTY